VPVLAKRGGRSAADMADLPMHDDDTRRCNGEHWPRKAGEVAQDEGGECADRSAPRSPIRPRALEFLSFIAASGKTQLHNLPRTAAYRSSGIALDP